MLVERFTEEILIRLSGLDPYETVRLTLLHSEQPKLYRVLAVLSAKWVKDFDGIYFFSLKKKKRKKMARV